MRARPVTLPAMITLSSSLAAHQKLPARLPQLRAFAYHSHRSYPILNWQRLYTGAEPDSPIALTLASDGSLIRARNASGTLYTSRVTSPGPASTYSSWTNTTTCHTSAGIALASTPGELTLAYINPAGTSLITRHSTDNGATWSAPSTRATEATQITHIAAAYNPSGNLALFYTLTASPTLKHLRRTAGLWDPTPTTWTRSADLSTITGIAATHHNADFPLIITATIPSPANDKRVLAYRFGDGGLPLNAWSSPTTIAETDAPSTITYANPAIVNLNHILASFAQPESANVTANPAMLTHPPPAATVANPWAEPSPHQANHPFGLALATLDQLNTWAATPSGVWFAQRITTTLDLTPHITAATYTITPTTTTARLTLQLANSNLLPPPSTLAPGHDLLIQPGYLSGTNAAFEYGTSLRLTINRLTYTHHHGRATLTIEAHGPWETAAHFHPPQSWQTNAGTLTRAAIFNRIATRATIPATTISSSSPFTTNTPPFAHPAGETAASALTRLLSTVTDHTRPSPDGGFHLLNPLPTDTPSQTYGPSPNHPITTIATISQPPAANWHRLSGPDRYADSHNFPSLYQHGPRFHPHRDLDATTNPKTTDAATSTNRRQTLATPTATLTAPFHCGQEILDVITVTHPTLGLTSQNYRVIALTLDYTRTTQTPTYNLTLTLGEP